MDIQTKKLNFIQKILVLSNEKIIDKLELLLREEQADIDPILKEKLTTRALKSNADIESGNVYSKSEALGIMKKRMQN